MTIPQQRTSTFANILQLWGANVLSVSWQVKKPPTRARTVAPPRGDGASYPAEMARWANVEVRMGLCHAMGTRREFCHVAELGG